MRSIDEDEIPGEPFYSEEGVRKLLISSREGELNHFIPFQYEVVSVLNAAKDIDCTIKPV